MLKPNIEQEIAAKQREVGQIDFAAQENIFENLFRLMEHHLAVQHFQVTDEEVENNFVDFLKRLSVFSTWKMGENEQNFKS